MPKTVTEGDRRDSILMSFSKILARYLSVKCNECGKERLLSAFEFYAGKNGSSCSTCSFTSHIMKPVMHQF